MIASSSIENAMQSEQNAEAAARKLHARYLLRGNVTRARDRLRMNVTLEDVEAGSRLWSRTLEQPVEQLAAINEAVVQETAVEREFRRGHSLDGTRESGRRGFLLGRCTHRRSLSGRRRSGGCFERAAAFAMLGEDERALTELAVSQKNRRYAGWWYTAELDPIYSRVRNDPRFQALIAQARAHRDRQRALLDEMRASGAVPTRS